MAKSQAASDRRTVVSWSRKSPSHGCWNTNEAEFRSNSSIKMHGFIDFTVFIFTALQLLPLSHRMDFVIDQTSSEWILMTLASASLRSFHLYTINMDSSNTAAKSPTGYSLRSGKLSTDRPIEDKSKIWNWDWCSYPKSKQPRQRTQTPHCRIHSILCVRQLRSEAQQGSHGRHRRDHQRCTDQNFKRGNHQPRAQQAFLVGESYGHGPLFELR